MDLEETGDVCGDGDDDEGFEDGRTLNVATKGVLGSLDCDEQVDARVDTKLEDRMEGFGRAKKAAFDAVKHSGRELMCVMAVMMVANSAGHVEE